MRHSSLARGRVDIPDSGRLRPDLMEVSDIRIEIEYAARATYHSLMKPRLKPQRSSRFKLISLAPIQDAEYGMLINIVDALTWQATKVDNLG